MNLDDHAEHDRDDELDDRCGSPRLSPYEDPMVKAAIKDGRDPSDIWLINCPACGQPSYYNQGSHFTCRLCQKGWVCITEEEEEPADGSYISLGHGDEYTLDDHESALGREGMRE